MHLQPYINIYMRIYEILSPTYLMYNKCAKGQKDSSKAYLATRKTTFPDQPLAYETGDLVRPYAGLRHSKF